VLITRQALLYQGQFTHEVRLTFKVWFRVEHETQNMGADPHQGEEDLLEDTEITYISVANGTLKVFSAPALSRLVPVH
jgi:hypothetical protein